MGSCTIRRDEYDVDEDGGEDTGGVDDSKYDATSMMLMRMGVWMAAASTIANKTRREDRRAS